MYNFKCNDRSVRGALKWVVEGGDKRNVNVFSTLERMFNKATKGTGLTKDLLLDVITTRILSTKSYHDRIDEAAYPFFTIAKIGIEVLSNFSESKKIE